MMRVEHLSAWAVVLGCGLGVLGCSDSSRFVPSGFAASAGGSSAGGGAEITVPPGSASDNFVLALRALANPGAGLSGYTPVGDGVSIEVIPATVTFSTPVTVEIPFDPALVPSGQSPADLVVIIRDPQGTLRVVIPVSVDLPNNRLIVETTGLGVFGVVAPAGDLLTVAFAQPSSSASETAGTLGVPVTISVLGGVSLGFDASVTAQVGSSVATAFSGTDYLFQGGLSVPAGSADQSSHNLNVTLIDDAQIELDEAFELLLTSASPRAGVGSPAAHIVTLTSDETATLDFSTSSSTASESSGSVVEVRLGVPGAGGATLPLDVTVEVTSTGGSASSGSDYQALSTTLTFAAGSADGATQTAAFIPLGDALVEGTETVELSLQNVTGPASLGSAAHTISLADDDTATLAFQAATAASMDESTPLTVNVVLTTSGATLAQGLTVEVVDAGGGTAVSATDYQAFGTQTLTFSTGAGNGAIQTATLTPIDDMLDEGNETVNLALQNPGALATLAAPSTLVATITDDETQVAFQLMASATTDESTPLLVSVELTIPSGNPLAAPLMVDVVDAGGGTAASGTDYTAFGTQTVTFGMGAMSGATMDVTLTPQGDIDVEGNETVNLALQNLSGPGSIGAQGTHAVTITEDDTASVAFQAAMSATTDEGTALPVAVTLTIPGGGTLANPVMVSLVDAGGGTATPGSDYPAVGTQTLTFGVSSGNGAMQSFTLVPTQDLVVEGASETLNLALQAPSGPAALGMQTTHQVTITEDDAATLAFQAATSATTNEMAPHAVTVVLQTMPPGGSLGAAASVEVVDAGGGTASSGMDYAAFGMQMATFGPGSLDGALQSVTLTLMDDALVEGGETVNLAAQNPSGAVTLGMPVAHQVTITDDEASATVAFQAPGSMVLENAGPGHTVTVVLTTPAPLGQAVTVDVVDALSGTATSGSDFTAFGTQGVTFGVGSMTGATQSVTLTLIDDNNVENPETVDLALQNLGGPANLAAPMAHTVTINENDTATVAFMGGMSMASGEAMGHMVAVALTIPSGGQLDVAVTADVTDAGGGTAVSVTDYAAFGTQGVTFGVGAMTGAVQSVTLTPVDDLLIEAPETVNLALGNVGGPGTASLGMPIAHQVSITDDDTATVAFQMAASATTNEATGPHAVGVALTASPAMATLAANLTVNVATADVTATAGADYTALSTMLTFAGGTGTATQSVNVGILDDMVSEGPETLTLTLSGISTNGSLGMPAVHTVTITDDDNLPPTPMADTGMTSEDTPLVVMAPGLLMNDTDPDMDPLTVSQFQANPPMGPQTPAGMTVATPLGANLTINGNGSYTYDPNGAFESLAMGQMAMETVNYTADDGNGGTTAANLTVTVNGANDAPTDIALDNASVAENQAAGTLVGNLSATDVDAGAMHSFSLVAGTGDTDNASFQIMGGQLQTAAMFDFEAPFMTASIRLRADDGLGGTFDEVFTITITNVNEAPTATADDFTATPAVGNTEFGVGQVAPVQVMGSVTANDSDPEMAMLMVTGTSNVTMGASVTMNTDGTFVYVPPVGFNGTDTFDYTVSDGGLTANATVSIQVNGLVWYVDNTAAGGGTGTSAARFNTLAAAQAAASAGQTIYVFQGDGMTTGQNAGITLANNQVLLGAGVDLVVGMNTLFSAGAAPVIGNSSGDGVTLGSGNTVRGLSINASGRALTGAMAGTLTVNTLTISNGGVDLANGALTVTIDSLTSTGSVGVALNTVTGNFTVTSGSITNPTGAGFAVSGATAPTINYAGTISKTTAGRLVQVNGITGGMVSLTGGPLTANAAASTGLSFTGMTGGTVSLPAVDLGSNMNRLTSDAVTVNNSGGAVTIANLDVFTAGGRGVVSSSGALNVTTGTLDVMDALGVDQNGGALNATFTSATANNMMGGGLRIQNNGMNSVTFTTVDLDSNGGPGLLANAGGTVNVLAGTIDAVGGRAVDCTGTVLNLSLTTTNATNGAIDGVSLVNNSGTANLGNGTLASSATGFFVDQGTATISYAGAITGSGRAIDVEDITGGAVMLTGSATNMAGTGIRLHNNQSPVSIANASITNSSGDAVTVSNNSGAGAMTFSNLDVSNTTSGQRGMFVTGTTATVTVNATGGGSTLNCVNATAVTVTGSPTPLAMSFQSISSSGATNGIVLNNTTGSFATTGAAMAAGSGGTIANTTGHGVMLTTAAGVSLGFLNVTNAGNGFDGINGTGVSNLTLNGCLIQDNGVASGDHGVELENLSGTCAFTNTTFNRNATNNIRLRNGTGTLTGLTISGCTISNTGNGAAPGDSGLLVVSGFSALGGAGSMTISINTTQFLNNRATGYQADVQNTGTLTNTVTTSSFVGNNVSLNLTQSQSGVAAHDIINNTAIREQDNHAINIFSASASTGGRLCANVEGNPIGVLGVQEAGSRIGNGVRVRIQGNTRGTVRIHNNTFHEFPQTSQIEVEARDPGPSGPGNLDLTVTNNQVFNQTAGSSGGGPLEFEGLFLQARDGFVVQLHCAGNTFPDPGAGIDSVFVNETAPGVLEVVGTAGNVSTEIANTNTVGGPIFGDDAQAAIIAGPVDLPCP